MRTPVAIYPYCTELLPVVKHFERFQEDFSIALLISPPGLGLDGRDAAYACNHPNLGITVVSDIDAKNDAWEILYLCCPKQPNVVDDAHLVEMATRALKAGKKVMFFIDNADSISCDMKGLQQLYPNQFDVQNCVALQPPHIDMGIGHKQLRSPVVLVGGLITGEDSFYALTSLAVCLRKLGLDPMVFSASISGYLLGFHNYSYIFEDNDISADEKIEAVNALVANLEYHAMPDIILLEATDALLRYNNTVPNGYGINAFMLCQAVEPDMLVLCLPCDMFDKDMLDTLSKDFSIRLGSAITAVHISNVIIDSAEVLQSNTITNVRLGMDDVEEALAIARENKGIPAYNVVLSGAGELARVILEFIMNLNGGNNNVQEPQSYRTASFDGFQGETRH